MHFKVVDMRENIHLRDIETKLDESNMLFPLGSAIFASLTAVKILTKAHTTRSLDRRKEDPAAVAWSVAISIDLNRESILTDTNDVTLTLKTIRIEFFPIFLWFFEISNQLSSFHSTFVSFNVVFCSRHSL